MIVGETGPESDVNLLIKQQKKFDKRQNFQADKAYERVERTSTAKKSQERKI